MKIDTKTCIRLGITVFLTVVAIMYWPAAVKIVTMLLGVAAPILIGFAIAYIINIPMSFYEKKLGIFNNRIINRIKRVVSMLLAFLSIIVVLFLVIILVLPNLQECIMLLIEQIPAAVDDLINVLQNSSFLNESSISADLLEQLDSLDWRAILEKTVNAVVSGIGSIANYSMTVITSIFSFFTNIFLAFIVAIYLLMGKEKLGGQFKKLYRHYFKDNIYEKTEYVLKIVNRSFKNYIVGQCTEAVILGALCALGMIVFRFPYASVVGAIVGVTALIPVAGAYIGGSVGFILILTISPIKAILFVVYLVILQQFEGNVIYPRVVGASLGLPGLWVLCAVIVGGGIAGIPGMMFGVPVTSSIYQLLKNDVNKSDSEKKKNAGKDKNKAVPDSQNKENKQKK